MEFPNITMTPKPIFDLFGGTTKSWVLMTAIEFKVFNLTVENKTASEIASSLKSHEANTVLFLNALCAIQLLKKENGAYRNTELSDIFLVQGNDCYLGELLMLSNQWNFQTREQMADAVKNGPGPQAENFDDVGEMFASHVKAMGNYSRAGNSQLIAKEISKLPEFAGMKRMLDLGGAHGMDCIAVTQKSASLKGVVFDNPAVIKITREIIAEYGMENTVAVMEGDYAKDHIGMGYDLIYAKATLNFFKDNLHPLFSKIYEALNPGGVFVSVHDGLTEEGTKPSGMVVSWLPTSLSSKDLSFDRDMIPDAMLEAGFKSVKLKPIPVSMCESMDICIGRK
ncbi:methyltransferase dimerization domain-containing protein [uncultured Desulfobacter sp.]|uniref:methyltransferase n=1 Tax=uncultured Desulfobacter sp. TaxID=240139 RepID=UPI0029F4A9A6|nr:methyltransferase dimerization domain-containing protein [uncultured Desulfobacter sp.]